MAKLTEAETRVILGPDYVAPVVTPETLAAAEAASRRSRRNTAIGIGGVILLVLIAALFRTGG